MLPSIIAGSIATRKLSRKTALIGGHTKLFELKKQRHHVSPAADLCSSVMCSEGSHYALERLILNILIASQPVLNQVRIVFGLYLAV